MKKENFVFTVDNLLDNLHKMGAWSSYGMAGEALSNYFPNLYDYENYIYPTVMEEIELLDRLGCKNWHDLISKYHKDVGYKTSDGTFNIDAVNEF